MNGKLSMDSNIIKNGESEQRNSANSLGANTINRIQQRNDEDQFQTLSFPFRVEIVRPIIIRYLSDTHSALLY